MHSVACPHCGKVYRIRPTDINREMWCRRCKQQIRRASGSLVTAVKSREGVQSPAVEDSGQREPKTLAESHDQTVRVALDDVTKEASRSADQDSASPEPPGSAGSATEDEPLAETWADEDTDPEIEQAGNGPSESPQENPSAPEGPQHSAVEDDVDESEILAALQEDAGPDPPTRAEVDNVSQAADKSAAVDADHVEREAPLDQSPGTPLSDQQFCRKCGARRSLEDQYCGACGSPLKGSQKTQEPKTPVIIPRLQALLSQIVSWFSRAVSPGLREAIRKKLPPAVRTRTGLVATGAIVVALLVLAIPMLVGDESLVVFKMPDDPVDRKTLASECDDDNDSSCLLLARAIYQGEDGDQNATKGKSLATVSCEDGFGPACTWLGHVYVSEKNPEQGMAYYRNGCDGFDAEGCFFIAVALKNGWWGVEKNLQESINLLTKSCNADFFESCAELAGAYFKGDGVEKNTSMGLELANKACDGRAGKTCTDLGEAYLLGRQGLPRDEEMADQMFSKACDAKHGKGCHWLGLRLGGRLDSVGKAGAYFKLGCQYGYADSCKLAEKHAKIEANDSAPSSTGAVSESLEHVDSSNDTERSEKGKDKAEKRKKKNKRRSGRIRADCDFDGYDGVECELRLCAQIASRVKKMRPNSSCFAGDPIDSYRVDWGRALRAIDNYLGVLRRHGNMRQFQRIQRRAQRCKTPQWFRSCGNW